jgi:hypothetical protein
MQLLSKLNLLLELEGYDMNSLVTSFLTVVLIAFFGTNVFAVADNQTAEVMNPCVATSGSAGIISQSPASAACGATPQKYEITVVEMGVCTSHPYGALKTAEPFDASTCSVVYSDATPSAVDVAKLLGSALGMDGESVLPPVGTYQFPYILFVNQFVSNTTFEAGNGSFWYGKSNGSASQASPAQDRTETLDNFGGPNCFSGYVGASVLAGTIDGFITNSAKLRSATGTANPCALRTHLVGVLTLDQPFSITTQTAGLNFQFNLTGQGTQFMSNNGNNVTPEEYGSAPFSGVFTVVE